MSVEENEDLFNPEPNLELTNSNPEDDIDTDHSVGSTTIKLIRQVEKYEELYNSTYFKDTTRTKKAWHEISEVMGVSAEVCKRKWNCLRDTYRRTKRKLDDLGISSLDPGLTTVSWEYYKYMTFLHPYIRKKKDSNPDIIEVKTEYDPNMVVTTSLTRRPKKITSTESSNGQYNHESIEQRKRSLMIQNACQSMSDSMDDIYAGKYPKLESASSPDKFMSTDPRNQGSSAIPQFSHQSFPIIPDCLASRLQEDDLNHVLSKSSFFNQSQFGLSSTRVHDTSLPNSLNFTHSKQEEEADNLFVRSIAASLSRFPPKLKAMAKVKIQKALWEAEEAFEQFPNSSVNFVDTTNNL